MIKLCVDFSGFKTPTELQTGVGINAILIVKRIIKDDDICCEVIVKKDIEEIVKKQLLGVKVLTLRTQDTQGVVSLIKDRIIGPYKIIEKEKPDAVLIPRLSAFNIINKRFKYVAILHDLDFLENTSVRNLIRRLAIRVSINKIKELVVISHYIKEELLKWNPNIKTNINVIYNSITPPKFIDNSSHIRKYILSVNSFKKSKNQITLLRAFNLIKDKIPHCLFLVGYGDKTDIQTYINSHNLNKRVKILQNLQDDEMHSIYSGADLFVNTSTFEGFGRTPVEAAMFKLPVISTKDTSLYEVTMGKVEYYEPSFDYKALAEKILGILSGEIIYTDERKEIIKSDYINRYSQEVIGMKYLNLIKSISAVKEMRE